MISPSNFVDSGTRPKWQRRKAARPTEILEAALNVFSEKSVSAATIDDIALRAGVRRSRIYLYFRNKEQVFSELTRAFQPVMPSLRDARARQISFDKQLRRMVGAVNAAPMEPRAGAVLRLVSAEAQNFPAIADAYYEAIDARLLEPLVEVISRGIAQRKFRPIDPYLAARLAVAVPLSTAIANERWNPVAPHAGSRRGSSKLLETHIDFFVRAMIV